MTTLSATEIAVLITSEIAPPGTEPFSAEWHYWRGVALKAVKAYRRHEARAQNAGQVQHFKFDDKIKELVPMNGGHIGGVGKVGD